MFSSLTNDRIVIEKPDGTRLPEAKGSVSAKMIFIPDGRIPLEEGDTIIRTIPSGADERYLVIDPGYHADHGGIPAHYQVKFEKETRFKKPSAVVGDVYFLNGASSRVIKDSIDYSVNVVNVSRDQLFSDLRSAISEGVPDPHRDALLAAVEALAALESKKTFASRYAEVVQLGANYMTIIGPFLPALTQLLVAQQ